MVFFSPMQRLKPITIPPHVGKIFDSESACCHAQFCDHQPPLSIKFLGE